MNRTEIIRTACETARSRRASPEVIESMVESLLTRVEPEKRMALRYEIDNALASVKREFEKDAERDLSGMFTRPPKEKS